MAEGGGTRAMFSGLMSACSIPRLRRNDSDVSSCTAMLRISGSVNVRAAADDGAGGDGRRDADEDEEEDFGDEEEDDEGAVTEGERKQRGWGGGAELRGSPNSSRTRHRWPPK
jgi:hypothetical protein